MKKEIGTEKQDSHLVRRKWKRVIAMILSILMVTSAIDYSGFVNVSAETIDAEASVTDAGGTVTNYTTLEEAIAAAVNMSGSTVTLLTDATTETIVEVYSGTFTIDLNGKTWTGPVDDIALGLFSNAKVTLKDSGVGGNISSTRGCVLCVYSVEASLAIEGGTYTGIMNGWGTIGVLLAEGYAYRDSNGTWVSDVSSTQIANVTVQEAPVRITAQPQDAGALLNYTDAHTLSVTAVTVPATSGNDITYQWYSVGTGSGSTDEAITGATDASYTVSASLAEGTYTYYCAITCDNYTVNTRKVEFTVSIAPGKEARVTASDGSVTDYTTLEEAITAAQGMNGSTVMLVKNVATEALMTITSGTFTIDLNGKTWNNTASTGAMALYLNGTAASQISITFKDSGTGGTFTSVKTYAIYVGSYASASIEGGTYTGIFSGLGTIGDLLAEGYVYRDSSGAMVSDLSGNIIKNVTVGEAPVQITTQPEDVVAAPDYTLSPVLNVTTETVPADSGNTISYQWYSVGTGSGGADEAISGATDASYTISTGLAEGTYTYYCAIACDGYTVNTRNAAFYVSSSTGKFSVTDSNNNTINYPTLEIAITAAKSKPNSTVKLLENASTASTVEVGSGTFTIDLNGMTWTSTVSASHVALYLTYGSHVTLKDSASGGTFTSAGYATILVIDAPLTIENGIYKNTTVSSGMPTSVLFANSWYETVTIKGGNFINNDSHGYTACLQQARVSISGGTFSGQSVYFEKCSNVSLTGGTYDKINVYDSSVSALLASGYGFKNVSGGTWVNNLGNNTNDLSHNYLSYATTVQLAPVQITAQPQGGEAVTYGYTSTEVPTLSVTAAKTTAAPDGSEISYQWYRVKSGTETSDTAVGTNSSTLTIPTGLDAGTHSFYCAVSCDGYIVKSNTADVTVNKAEGSIANSTYATDATYTSGAITTPLPTDFTTNSGGNVTFTWYTGDSTADADLMTAAPSGVGTYTLKAEVAETDNYNASSTTVKVTISYLVTDAVATLSGTIDTNDWYASDVTVAAPADYSIAASNGSDAVWGSSLTVNTDSNGAYTYYLKQNSTGDITDAKTVTIKRDTTAPDTGTISYSEHRSFLDWLFHRDRITVAVPITDTLSGADHISYVLIPNGSKAQTMENGTPQAQTASVDSDGNAVFTVEKDFMGTITVTAYDKAGNASTPKEITKLAVEDMAPTLTVNDGTAEFMEDWYTTAQTLHISASDTGSGIQSVTCAIDDGDADTLFLESDTDTALTESKDGLTVSTLEGTHTYTITVTDNALNTVTRTLTIHQDTKAPTLKYVIGASSSKVTDTTAAIKVTASESGSFYYLAKESGSAPTLEELYATTARDMTAGNQNTISLNGLKRNTVYTIYVAAKDEAGNQTATVTGVMLETAKTSLTGAEVTLTKNGNPVDENSYTYNGTSQIPDVAVSVDGTTVDENQYSISYSNTNGGSGNTTDAGTVTVSVSAAEDSNYTGTATATYVMKKKPVTLTAANVTKQYGQANPALTLLPVALGQLVGDDTIDDLHITLSTTAGTASEAGTYAITGIGSNANYEVTVSGTLSITKIDAALTVAATAITSTYGDKAFSLGAATAGNALLSYQSSNTSVATVNSAGTVVIKGCGIVTLTITAAGTSYNTVAKTITLTVKPKTMGTPSLKSSVSKKLTVTWKKDSQVSGYQIAYSTSSKFTAKTTKTVTVKSYKTLTKTINKLKSGKKYYVHIRSYKSSGNTTVYGGWSKTAKINVK